MAKRKLKALAKLSPLKSRRTPREGKSPAGSLATTGTSGGGVPTGVKKYISRTSRVSSDTMRKRRLQEMAKMGRTGQVRAKKTKKKPETRQERIGNVKTMSRSNFEKVLTKAKRGDYLRRKKYATGQFA